MGAIGAGDRFWGYYAEDGKEDDEEYAVAEAEFQIQALREELEEAQSENEGEDGQEEERSAA